MTRRTARWAPTAVLLVVLLVVAACTGAVDPVDLPSSRPTSVGSSDSVPGSGGLHLSAGGIAIDADPGAVEASADPRPRPSQVVPPRRIEKIGIVATGPGVSLTLSAEQIHQDITLTFPAAVRRDGSIPAVAHQRHDGHWELRFVTWNQAASTASLRTREFSDNILVWLDPAKITSEIRAAVVQFLTGRTPSPGCAGNAHRWSRIEDDEDLVHACLTTNDSAAVGERAELRLTSNRAAYVQVDIPAGADYVWMDGQPQLVRTVVGATLGVDGRRTVFLAPGAAMTIGWHKPPPPRSETVTVSASLNAMRLSLALGGLKLLDPKIDAGTSTVAAIIWGCAKAQGKNVAMSTVNPTDVAVCIAGGVLGNLADPKVGLKLASQWLGPSATDGELVQQTERLTTAGKRFATVGVFARVLLYVQAVREGLLDIWGTVSDQLQTAVLQGGGTDIAVILTVPTLETLGVTGSWERHGGGLTLRADGTGTWINRTYSEQGDDERGMIFAVAHLSLRIADDSRTVVARVTRVEFRFNSQNGQVAPTPDQWLEKVGDVYSFRKKSSGALNFHRGSVLTVTDGDLAWCRQGVSDEWCGA